MKNHAGIYIPDAGDIVEFGLDSFGREPQTWRVKGWYKESPHRWTYRDYRMSGAFHAETGMAAWKAILDDILFESCRENMVSSGRKVGRIESCPRAEAEFVGLVSISGAIAPIEECKFLRVVEWDEIMLAETRQSARRHGEARRVVF